MTLQFLLQIRLKGVTSTSERRHQYSWTTSPVQLNDVTRTQHYTLSYFWAGKYLQKCQKTSLRKFCDWNLFCKNPLLSSSLSNPSLSNPSLSNPSLSNFSSLWDHFLWYRTFTKNHKTPQKSSSLQHFSATYQRSEYLYKLMTMINQIRYLGEMKCSGILVRYNITIPLYSMSDTIAMRSNILAIVCELSSHYSMVPWVY